VAAVELLGALFAGNYHFFSIDHNHVVPRIQVRGEVGFVLAPQELGHNHGQAAEALVGSVHQIPARG
jgi:hypothetical protein